MIFNFYNKHFNCNFICWIVKVFRQSIPSIGTSACPWVLVSWKMASMEFFVQCRMIQVALNTDRDEQDQIGERGLPESPPVRLYIVLEMRQPHAYP